MGPDLLRLENVSRAFDGGSIVALDKVTLSIGRNECIAIVGKSGSGKSCLLNVATGLDQPDEGEVLWEGRAVHSDPQWRDLRRNHLGIVFQEFHLLPTLTAMQNVELALMGGGFTQARQAFVAREILEKVGLGHRLESLPGQLSGGERQRVAIARALVREPDILFADEPTGNLDSESTERIADLLFGLRRERRAALVLVTHDEGLAARCDRIVRMHDGRIADDRRISRELAS